MSILGTNRKSVVNYVALLGLVVKTNPVMTYERRPLDARKLCWDNMVEIFGYHFDPKWKWLSKKMFFLAIQSLKTSYCTGKLYRNMSLDLFTMKTLCYKYLIHDRFVGWKIWRIVHHKYPNEELDEAAIALIMKLYDHYGNRRPFDKYAQMIVGNKHLSKKYFPKLFAYCGYDRNNEDDRKSLAKFTASLSRRYKDTMKLLAMVSPYELMLIQLRTNRYANEVRVARLMKQLHDNNYLRELALSIGSQNGWSGPVFDTYVGTYN